MTNFFDPDALRYFFGSEFNVDVAMSILPNYKDAKTLEDELRKSLDEGEPHIGIQFIGYRDVDKAFSAVAMMRHPGHLSGVSFFAESRHRLFGGSTLVCVPLAFCSTLYKPHGEYTVYRHTYKKPRFTAEEMKAFKNIENPEQKAKAWIYTKWREGYETIPGMSYVGITSRSWQERYIEHVEKSLEGESSTHFHNAMRAMQGQQVICVHDVSAFGVSKAEAKAYESELIKKSTLHPLGLNMKV